MKKESNWNKGNLKRNIIDLQNLIKKLINKQMDNQWFSSAEEMLYELVQWFKMQITKKIKVYWSEIVLNSKVKKNGNIILDVDDWVITITPESPHWSQIIDFINLLSDYKKAINHKKNV